MFIIILFTLKFPITHAVIEFLLIFLGVSVVKEMCSLSVYGFPILVNCAP